MGARQLDLLRRWTLRPDPDDAGLGERWWDTPPLDGWVSCRADEPWQVVLGESFHGVGWYRRRARLPRKWLGSGQRTRLRFGAVATDCRVWVNGTEVGRHTGDYIPFEFDITDALDESERCEIVCRVDEIKGEPPEVWGEEPWGGHLTKGFHDVVGLQHGGVWDGVSVRTTGSIAVRPNGLSTLADAASGEVRVRVELHDHLAAGAVEVILVEPGTGRQQRGRATIPRGAGVVEVLFRCERVHQWSPDDPVLGNVHASVRTSGAGARDEAIARFAFRTVAVGGRGDRRVLLNGSPLLIRGVLDWCVEPEHIAPAPTREELVERFAELRARGFNCVCLCMVYPPDYFYDVADETGMLLWQIHPVWKSAMSPEHIPEYRRLFDEFFRRDRQHASVVLVSATCEHEGFDAELGTWWWGRGREELPSTLLQVQTGFLRWIDAARTDVFDEHVYDNSGRWLCYLDDLEEFLEIQPPRPFIMGETIIGTSWPDTGALAERLGDARQWWRPTGFDGFIDFEQRLVARKGDAALDRLRAHGEVFSLAQRKLQCEVFRSRAHNTGWVMNHLRDVRSCQSGFQDDLGRWRFGPEQLRPFLGDRAILLRTPSYAVGLVAGECVRLELGLSNFGSRTFEGAIRMWCRVDTGAAEIELPTVEERLRIEPGEVAFTPIELEVPAVTRPALIRCVAEADGAEPNEWRVWAFPKRCDTPDGVFCDSVALFTDVERAPDFEERRYSSGWALECSSWRPRLPDLASLLSATPTWRADGPRPDVDILTLITTRITEHSLLHLEQGGRVVLLASKAGGSPPTTWVNLYGQVPQIDESSGSNRDPLLASGEGAWVVDTLGLDLNRWSCRAVPTQELGIEDVVDPIVRLVFTHDKETPEVWDQVFTARIGAGLLAVSTLDHDCPAGRYLLHRLIGYVHRPAATSLSSGRLSSEVVRAWCGPA